MNRQTLGKSLLRSEAVFAASGRRICRYIHCYNEVPKGRRTWCSDQCVHEYRLRGDWKYARQQLRKRERCVCQACATNTLKLKSSLMKLWKPAVQIGKNNRLHKNLYQFAEYAQLNLEYSQIAQTLTERGFHGFVAELPKSWRPRRAWKEPRDLWEADHIVAVVHGGTHEPSNLRTLCHPCHKQVTNQLAKSRRVKAVAIESLHPTPEVISVVVKPLHPTPQVISVATESLHPTPKPRRQSVLAKAVRLKAKRPSLQ